MVQSSSLARCQRAWLMESCYPRESTQPLNGVIARKAKGTDPSPFLSVYAPTTIGLARGGTTALVGAMPRFELSRKNFIALCSGSTAPGACAQKVLPGPRKRDQLQQGSISPACPSPCSIACSSLTDHGKPSRQGVHQPQDSRAKNCFQVAHQGHHVAAVVHRHDQAGTHAAAHLGDAVVVHCPVQVFRQQEVGTGAAGSQHLSLKPSCMPPA